MLFMRNRGSGRPRSAYLLLVLRGVAGAAAVIGWTMMPVACSMMDDMVSHHELDPAPLHSGVLLTAYSGLL